MTFTYVKLCCTNSSVYSILELAEVMWTCISSDRNFMVQIHLFGMIAVPIVPPTLIGSVLYSPLCIENTIISACWISLKSDGQSLIVNGFSKVRWSTWKYKRVQKSFEFYNKLDKVWFPNFLTSNECCVTWSSVVNDPFFMDKR